MLVITDSLDFAPMRRAGVGFEHVPAPGEAQPRLAGGDYDSFLRSRIALILAERPRHDDTAVADRRETVDAGGHATEDDIATPRGPHRIRARAVDRRPDELRRRLAHVPGSGMQRLAPGHGTGVDLEAVPVRADATREALAEAFVSDAHMASRCSVSFRQREHARWLEVELDRSRLCHERVAFVETSELALHADLERRVE